MTQRFIRWAVVPVMLLALTGCTQLTNADGFAPTPVPSTAPSATSNEWPENSEEYGFGIPEETPEPLTKESLPDPVELIPESVANAVSLGDLEATETQRSLRLPQPVKSGTLSVLFACVDGDFNIAGDEIGGMGVICDGSTQAFSFGLDEGFKSLKINLTVSPGTSYSLAAYQDLDATIIFD